MKSPCPDEEMVAAYIEGLLPERLRAHMEAHLSVCDVCLAEFKVTNHMVKGGIRTNVCPVPPEVTESAVRLINSRNDLPKYSLRNKIGDLVSALRVKVTGSLHRGGTGQAALTPIRGSQGAVSDELFHIQKNFKDFDVHIGIEKTGEDMAHIRIWLSSQKDSGNNTRVTLKRNGRELCSSLLSGGHVVFEDIPFGPCRLIFDRDGVSLGVYAFNIKETRY